MSENQRVRLTKRIIREALIDLMQQYTVEEISIKQLCEQAEINRSTFYAHYRNIREVLDEISARTYQELDTYISENEHVKNKKVANQLILKLILDYALKEHKLFEVLLGDRGDIDFQQDILLLVDKFVTDSPVPKDRSAESYLRIYAVAGTIAVVKEWLATGAIETTTYMSKILTTLNK